MSELRVAVADGLTVTMVDVVLVQPLALVTVTEYVVVVVGATASTPLELVVPSEKRYDAPPEAVNVVEVPSQMVAELALMSATGNSFTVTVPDVVLIQPVALATVTE